MKNFTNYFKKEKLMRGGYFHCDWISILGRRIEAEGVNVGGQIQDRFVIE